MNNYVDASHSVGTGYSNVETKTFKSLLGEMCSYSHGNVITPYGIVLAYSQEEYSSLSFVWRGRRYDRAWYKEYTPRTLSKLAKQFAKDIVNQNDYGKK